MRARGLIAAAALALAACAAGTPPPPSQNVVVGATTKEESQAIVQQPQGAHGGDWTAAVVGTPFLWVIKGIACVTTVAVAAPASAVLALRPEIYRLEEPGIGDAVAAHCGPPWVLTPPEAG